MRLLLQYAQWAVVVATNKAQSAHMMMRADCLRTPYSLYLVYYESIIVLPATHQQVYKRFSHCHSLHTPHLLTARCNTTQALL